MIYLFFTCRLFFLSWTVSIIVRPWSHIIVFISLIVPEFDVLWVWRFRCGLIKAVLFVLSRSTILVSGRILYRGITFASTRTGSLGRSYNKTVHHCLWSLLSCALCMSIFSRRRNLRASVRCVCMTCDGKGRFCLCFSWFIFDESGLPEKKMYSTFILLSSFSAVAHKNVKCARARVNKDSAKVGDVREGVLNPTRDGNPRHKPV